MATSAQRNFIPAVMLKPAEPQEDEGVPDDDVQRVRRLFEEESGRHPHFAIDTPREDAKQFRSPGPAQVPCECVAELYELLWRWGHRAAERAGSASFVQNFGFSVPETIVIVQGRPYAWYFISKKDGRLLRKTAASLTVSQIEKKLCKETPGKEGHLAGVWLPGYSQFLDTRSHSSNAEFYTAAGLGGFLGGLRNTHNGVIQAFVEPPGISNFLARTVTYRHRTSLMVRQNRAVLNSKGRNIFDRAATFEGWEGLSACSGHYSSHKFPHMEELILAAGEGLLRRIEEENVRDMLFMAPDQHVALHFKVARDGMLFFIFGSIVPEREVLLQMRERLILDDRSMTEDLPNAALLRGGASASGAPRMPIPYEVRHDMAKWYPSRSYEGSELDAGESGGAPLAEALVETPRGTSLPPSRLRESVGSSASRRAGPPLSARGPLKAAGELSMGALPRMAYPHPRLPEAPYKVNAVGDADAERRRYEQIAARAISTHDQIKRPLVSERTSGMVAPLSARLPQGRTPAATLDLGRELPSEDGGL